MSRRARSATLAAVLTGIGLVLSACSGGFGESGSAGAARTASSGPVTLRMLVGVSTDAELDAVRKATEQWASRTGSTVEVTASANLQQELAKGFAGGSPPDLFYVEPAQLGSYAKAGNLHAYGDKVADIDYLPALKHAFTYRGVLQCAPKDVSTLALVIDESAWKAAGLTDQDLPADWAALEKVAARLTKGQVTGLVLNPEVQRLGAFMVQAGGTLVSADGRTATLATAPNVAGLTEARRLLAGGAMKFSRQVDAGWGGEALVKGRAAMVVEGNWIRGALAKDAPDKKVRVVELPAGPKGRGTLLFTTCWGIAARSAHPDAAVDLVRFLARDEQQLHAAKAFGVMPSTTKALAMHEASTPEDEGFAAGLDHAVGMPNAPGMDAVLTDLNAGLESLAGTDPQVLLDRAQRDAQAALGG